MNTRAQYPVGDAETLDPHNWESMRRLGHRIVDDVIDYLMSASEGPVWRSPDPDMQHHFSYPAPMDSDEPERVYEEFLNRIMPYGLGNTHARFWAWYMGNGTVLGAFAELLAATMNSNTGAGCHGAMVIEKQVLQWIVDLLGFPSNSSGLLVSGGSMANLVGLAVARNQARDTGVSNQFRRNGYQFDNDECPCMKVYASVEVHSSVQKAVELMGMGSRSLVKIAVDDHYRIRLEHLERTIQNDLANGEQPVCVIASAGTVNTGAIDDLPAISKLCQKYGVWMHVDGAIGAVAVLSPVIKPLLVGLELADSIALDLHKWMHIPFEAGCIVVRDRSLHRETFALEPEYLSKQVAGVASGRDWFSEYGVQLSRQFRALKVWMTIREHGLEKLGRMMSKNVAQATYLKQLIEQHDNLQLCAPVGLDIVCYRWFADDIKESVLDDINQKILVELQESGIAVPSYTRLNSTYCLRVAISNHRSQLDDFTMLIDETVRLGVKFVQHIKRNQ